MDHLFDKLAVWRDATPRSGPENMAVDEWLAQSLGEVPVLRLYDWAGDWVSLGYFQSLAEAHTIFGDEPDYVRRWTGGGIVDHRGDLTYTLVIPRSHDLASQRGNESYCAIHREIAKCLGQGGIYCDLTPKNLAGESAACFESPVAWDLLNDLGEKIAGAGQRRFRTGMLHQGSVAAAAGALDPLPETLGASCEDFSPAPTERWRDLTAKYASPKWRERIS